MNVRILSAAARDLRDGHGFCERQAPGIDAYFLDSLYADIDSLSVRAGIHPVSFGRYHRLLSKRFPFAVYYRLAGEVATVYAVLDCRRNPAWTRQRIG